jgi:hypothetical protein
MHVKERMYAPGESNDAVLNIILVLHHTSMHVLKKASKQAASHLGAGQTQSTVST